MKKTRSFTLALTCAVMASLLTACGSNSASSPSADNAQKLMHMRKTAVTVTLTASSYQNVTQSLYIAYFGRPADPQGLVNVEAALLAAGAPTDAGSLAAAYGILPAVKTLIDSFATSPESLALYNQGGADVFVSSVFSNLFNRQPANEGLVYWSSAIQFGGLSRSEAALAILAGAIPNSSPQGLLDGQTVNNRITWANDFTAQVAAQNATASYSGSRSASIARNALSGVTAASDSSSFAASADATVTAIVGVKQTSSPSLNAIAWSGTQFVAVGAGGVVETSSDGVTWANRGSAINDAFSLANLSAVVWKNGKFLAVGTNGGHVVCNGAACPPLDAAQADVILSSTDGMTWTYPTGTGQQFVAPLGSELNALTWNGSQFVAVGDTLSESATAYSDNGSVLTSPDGVTWVAQTTVQGSNSAAFDPLVGVASSGTQTVAVSAAGYIYHSSNGTAWIQQTSGLNTLKAVIWSGSQFVAVGQGNAILTSTDGSHWTSQPVSVATLNAIAWSGTLFVAVGNGTILTSPDGTNWNARPSATYQSLNAINWFGSQFVAVGDGAIVTSPDGITWTSRSTP